jgi:hypothetical protein
MAAGLLMERLVSIDHSPYRIILHDEAMRLEKAQALRVRCPTCGAKSGEKCEINTGLPRTDPHPARCLAGERRAGERKGTA